METARPNLFKECKKCVIATKVTRFEIESPTLIDLGEKFTSTKIEIECEVEDSGPVTNVYMTRWHEGYFGNNIKLIRRREGESTGADCPHFADEWIF